MGGQPDSMVRQLTFLSGHAIIKGTEIGGFPMSLLFYALFVGGIVAADQFTKYLTVANIALYEDIPFIPNQITVHLGSPNDDNAPNVTLPFIDYIKNVASSEIYPTWPESALRANIYAQISFALNRIYTEYYPSRGYDFDITNSTANDQSFVYGRDIFENISESTLRRLLF